MTYDNPGRRGVTHLRYRLARVPRHDPARPNAGTYGAVQSGLWAARITAASTAILAGTLVGGLVALWVTLPKEPKR